MILFRYLALTLTCFFILIQEEQARVSRIPLPEKKRITILQGSKIYLEGTTNVSSFHCNCEDYFEPQYLELEAIPSHIAYNKASLKLTTKKLNCQNEKINRDMYFALKSDAYPCIKVELLDNWHDSNEAKKMNTWFNVKAKIRLTITNKSKEIFVQGTAKRTGTNTYELKGNKSILMSEYGIEPPQAMFGLIKVNDAISLNFYLKILAE